MSPSGNANISPKNSNMKKKIGWLEVLTDLKGFIQQYLKRVGQIFIIIYSLLCRYNWTNPCEKRVLRQNWIMIQLISIIRILVDRVLKSNLLIFVQFTLLNIDLLSLGNWAKFHTHNLSLKFISFFLYCVGHVYNKLYMLYM